MKLLPVFIPRQMGNEESKLRAALVCERRNLLLQDAIIKAAQQKTLRSVKAFQEAAEKLDGLGLFYG